MRQRGELMRDKRVKILQDIEENKKQFLEGSE